MSWWDGRHNLVCTRDSMAMRSRNYDLDELQRVGVGHVLLKLILSMHWDSNFGCLM